jgi:hypothetical protein
MSIRSGLWGSNEKLENRKKGPEVQKKGQRETHFQGCMGYKKRFREIGYFTGQTTKINKLLTNHYSN